MPRHKLRVVLGLLALAFFLAFLLPMVARAQGSGEKFDALLKTVMASPGGVQAMGRMVGLARGADEASPVKVAVQVTDAGQELEGYLRKVGGQVTSHHGSILVADLPFHALADLGSLPTVLRVEANTALMPTNDLSRQPAGANVDALVQADPRLTGKGVLVGEIDTGIDTALPAFKDAQGKTRILYYWSQGTEDATRHPSVTLPEGGTRTYGYGSEWTAVDIQNGTYDNTDPYAHGTHVAGTIGGRDQSYPGMAPEVHYMVVANDRDTYGDIWQGAGTGDTLDAYEYLLSRARELGLPLVTNQSQGTCMGPHDGSSLFEQAIQADIDSQPRNLIACISAGNNQQRNKAARITVPANGSVTARLGMLVYAADYNALLYNSVDVWCRGGAQPTLTVKRYSNGTYSTLLGTSPDIAYGAQGVYNTGAGRDFQLAKELPSTLNGDDRILFTDQSPSGTVNYYEFTFTNNSGTASTVDLYLQRNTPSLFTAGIVSTATLGMPGTTPGVISVGAYTTRPTYVDVDGNTQSTGYVLSQISPFSSWGPGRTANRYTGLNAWKPDLVAPGAMTISQKSRGSTDPRSSISQDGQHLVYAGTSMSTPVVAGLVALMLQEKPDARVADLKSALFAAARSDGFTGAVPNSTYGHGKVDATAINSLVAPTPVLTGAQRPSADPTTLRILGQNIALSSEVRVDGVLWPADKTTWVCSREIDITGVRAEPPIYTITVTNLKAPAGRQVGVLNLNSPGSGVVSTSGGGGCFVATAAYGSALEPEVMALRRFRDRHLVTNAPGRSFVALYYRYSPAAAEVIARHPSLRFAARVALTPVVLTVNHPGPALALAGAALLAALAFRRRRRQVA